MLTIIAAAAAIHRCCRQITEYYEKEDSIFSFFSLSIYTSPIATITCSATAAATCTATSGVNMVQVLKKKQIELKNFLYLLVSIENT